MTEPFHALGREANNELASDFEDQLVSLSDALGWKVLCRNIDAFVKHQGQSQSRGFDALVAIRDPQLRQRRGCVLEAKRHEAPAYGDAAEEAQVLHDKVARLNNTDAFWENAAIRKAIGSPLQHGIVCHRTLGFDPDKASSRRADATLRNRKHGAPVPVIQFLGPDILESLAFLHREYSPSKWLWPPMRRRDSEWSDVCSPWTLVGGMAAFRGEDKKARLWLHDSLGHGDAELIGQVMSQWGINPVELVCTQLKHETWRIVKDDWLRVAEQTANRETGRLPTLVEPVLLSERLTTFDETWAAAA